jgi:ribosomal subunit interface protein
MRHEIRAHDVTVNPKMEKVIEQKVAKLDQRLKSYHPDAAHLEVQLHRQDKTSSVRCALTLHAYQEALHAEKDAPELHEAVDRAFDAMFKELEHYRARINTSLQHNAPKAEVS